MKANAYVKIEESPSSGYISINEIILENYIDESYRENIESAKEFDFRNKVETLEGHKLKYFFMTVEFDGRKKSIAENDIKQSLEKQGLVTKVGSSMFGGYYLPTEYLQTTLKEQLNKRKELISQGKYELIA
ncbi:hypothetical protein JOC34_000493 [Virgibacillus halotolerans]|uniref:hypothetical protein n=1 Tax=Virgibacillus halotolerans TaxID=1071053 RepID=UPI001960DF24|nr:hypothetical protein [Virgibacillus halotolerans]MBM7598136.1 hypothetical protein [Virgibacillus halotolerans]